MDTSLKGSSEKDTIIDKTAESPGEAYWKSQVQKGQLLRSSSSMSLEGYSSCPNDSSTQGMFTPSPDEFGRNGELPIENDFETHGPKRSFSIMHDEEAKVENSLNADWDKKRVNEKEKKESHRDTKRTEWDRH